MTVISDKIANTEKRLAAIAKLGKSETGDKTKAAWMKEVVGILKEAKTFEKKHDDLNKKIADAKSLTKEIENYRKDYGSFIKEAVKLAQQSGKIGPDTKGRDYFMIANYLNGMGQMMLDDYP